MSNIKHSIIIYNMITIQISAFNTIIICDYKQLQYKLCTSIFLKKINLVLRCFIEIHLNISTNYSLNRIVKKK